MGQLARRDTGIRKATRVLSAFTESELRQHIRDSREKYELDKIAYMDLGIKKGRAEGSLAAKMETARNLLSMGLSLKQIVQATGLSLSEVKKLKDSD